MIRTIRKNVRNFVAIIVLAVVAVAVAGFILENQRFRFPLIEDKPFELKFELVTAQAVTPGQGQTVRVSGVRIGDISQVELVDGRAVVTTEIDREWEGLVRRDAAALLRPKTGLKDMFIELQPGSKDAPVAPEGFTVPISNTLPDVNPDEILGALDRDTRDYLRLLLQGGARGLSGRSDDLREVLQRFEPTYRSIARVSRTVAQRDDELKQLITSLNRLNTRLGNADDDLAELVDTSAVTFRAIASERDGLQETIRRLPGALSQTTDTLGRVEDLAVVLGPVSDRLRPVARALEEANGEIQPFAREAAPLIRSDIRPFVREARPFVRSLRPAVNDLVEAEPDLKRSIKSLNHLFNMLAYNPNGREGPEVRGRQEGYLFWLSWLTHISANLFGGADAHGPFRPITLGGTCGTFRALTQAIPGSEGILGLSGAFTDPRICGNGQDGGTGLIGGLLPTSRRDAEGRERTRDEAPADDEQPADDERAATGDDPEAEG